MQLRSRGHHEVALHPAGRRTTPGRGSRCRYTRLTRLAAPRRAGAPAAERHSRRVAGSARGACGLDRRVGPARQADPGLAGDGRRPQIRAGHRGRPGARQVALRSPELDGWPWRRVFVKVVDSRRAGHLHVLACGSARWGEQLAFCNAAKPSGGEDGVGCAWPARDIRLLALTSGTRSCRSGWGGSAEPSESAKPAGSAGGRRQRVDHGQLGELGIDAVRPLWTICPRARPRNSASSVPTSTPQTPARSA